MPQAAL